MSWFGKTKIVEEEVKVYAVLYTLTTHYMGGGGHDTHVKTVAPFYSLAAAELYKNTVKEEYIKKGISYGVKDVSYLIQGKVLELSPSNEPDYVKMAKNTIFEQRAALDKKAKSITEIEESL